MALVFSKVMTALLERTEITGFFARIARRRIEDVLKERTFPLLGVAVSDNAPRDAAGDGRVNEQANYTLLLATRLGDSQAQDEALEGMLDALRSAVAAFHYKQDGFAAQLELGGWAADEAEGDAQGRRVWLETDLAITYRPTD